MALDQPWLLSDHLSDLAAHINLAEEIATRRNAPVIKQKTQRARQLLESMTDDPNTVAEIRRLLGVTLPWVSMQPNSEVERAALKFLHAYDKSRA